MNKLDAYKMDGLGNDFVIFDIRKKSILLSKKEIIKISERSNVGCDQVIFIDNDKNNDASLKFYNSDGGEVSACGNGSRCVAYLLMKENKEKKITLGTDGRVLHAELKDENLVTVNMGQPHFEWGKIPLIKKMDNKDLQIKINRNDGKEISGGFSLNVGNPHVIFFVKDLEKFNLKEIGPKIENHNYFPKKCNVTLAAIKDKKHIRVKVWERGAGLTKACGTAACAAAVSSSFLNLTERSVNVEFLEGLLSIDWKMNNNIYMTGKVSEIIKIKINI